VIFEPGKNIYFSTYPPRTLIHFSHRFTSASKPAALKSFDCCLSYFRTWSGIICDFRTSLREFLDLVVNRFTRQTLPIVNRKHFFMNIFCIESFAHKKTHNITLFFGSTSSGMVAILNCAKTFVWEFGKCNQDEIFVYAFHLEFEVLHQLQWSRYSEKGRSNFESKFHDTSCFAF
jgi:hypothetical protein